MTSGTFTVQKRMKEHELVDGRSNVLNEFFFPFCQGLAFLRCNIPRNTKSCHRWTEGHRPHLTRLYRNFFADVSGIILHILRCIVVVVPMNFVKFSFSFLNYLGLLMRCPGLCNCTLQTDTIREWHSEQCGFL